MAWCPDRPAARQPPFARGTAAAGPV